MPIMLREQSVFVKLVYRGSIDGHGVAQEEDEHLAPAIRLRWQVQYAHAYHAMIEGVECRPGMCRHDRPEMLRRGISLIGNAANVHTRRVKENGLFITTPILPGAFHNTQDGQQYPKKQSHRDTRRKIHPLTEEQAGD